MCALLLFPVANLWLRFCSDYNLCADGCMCIACRPIAEMSITAHAMHHQHTG